MKRLTDKHPTKQKFDKLLAFLEDHNLSIEVGPYDTVVIRDLEQSDQDNIYVRDLDTNEPVTSLPPEIAYQLVKTDE